jgi:hypothetical protein
VSEGDTESTNNEMNTITSIYEKVKQDKLSQEERKRLFLTEQENDDG